MMEIELGKYYHFDDLKQQWEEKYPESEPLTINYLKENLSTEIQLYQVEGDYVAFHLNGLEDICKITGGALETAKIQFKNPEIPRRAMVDVWGIDHGSNSEGVVFFKGASSDFGVELEDAEHQRQLVNVQKIFEEPGEEDEEVASYHIPARGVVIKENTISPNRIAHNADCQPDFSEVDLSQSTLRDLITAHDSFRRLNNKSPQGHHLTVFDKPYLAIEDLSRRMYNRSNCSFVYSTLSLQSREYHEKYRKLLNLIFRFPDQERIFAYEENEAAGYGVMALLGHSGRESASNYEEYTANFAENFQYLFNEKLDLNILRKHRIYIEVFTSDQGGSTRDGTMQSFTLDPPKADNKAECRIRPCWMGYRGQRFTGGRYQDVIFKDALMANLVMALLGDGEQTSTSEAFDPEYQSAWEEGRQAREKIAADLQSLADAEPDLFSFGAYCHLLNLKINAARVNEHFNAKEAQPAQEIKEILEFSERILAAPLDKSVAEEITRLNDERLLKYFRLDQKPVNDENEHCRHPSLIYNIPLRKEDVAPTIANLSEKIGNLEITLSDGSRRRFKDCLLHLGELAKLKWAFELEKHYKEIISSKGIEKSKFNYQPGQQYYTSFGDDGEDQSLIKHFSSPDFFEQLRAFIHGLSGVEITAITCVDLFRMAQLFLPVICAEESSNFALIQKRQQNFYFAPLAAKTPESDDKQIKALVRRARVCVRQTRELFERTKKSTDKSSLLLPLSETIAEVLINIMKIVQQSTNPFTDFSKSWKEFKKLYKNVQARIESLDKWQKYCEEKEAPLPPLESTYDDQIAYQQLQQAAAEIRKSLFAAPVAVNLKNCKFDKAAVDRIVKTRSKLATLIDEFNNCSRMTFQTQHWAIILMGVSYYLAIVDKDFYPIIELIGKKFTQDMEPDSKLAADFEIFLQNFSGFLAATSSEETGKTEGNPFVKLFNLYMRWLKQVKKLLDEFKDSERIQGRPLQDFLINQELIASQALAAQDKKQANVSSFVFYIFSGQGVNILHKFMARHIYHSITLRNVDEEGKAGFAKGYRSQIHFFDIDRLFAIVFGKKEDEKTGAVSVPEVKKDHSLATFMRKSICRKLLTPLGLAIIGSYRYRANNEVMFTDGTEVELDPYDLIATSVGPESPNRIQYQFLQQLVSSVEDQKPVEDLRLQENIPLPTDRIYFVPAEYDMPEYFQVSKNGGKVNIWKRVESRRSYGYEWIPESYYFLGCFEFPQLEKEMELYLVPLVSHSHRKRDDRVSVFFKVRNENELYAQPNTGQKLPAEVLKLWDKDHDSAQEDDVYPSELFVGKVFILKELWPKPHLIAALTSQNHFKRFKILAEISSF